MHAPTTYHPFAIKRILRYLKGYLGTGLHLHLRFLSTMTALFYADWARCPDTCRSITGFCIFLGANLLSWASKKQPTFSCSSREEKYKTLAITVSELLWISYLLHDLRVNINLSMITFCNNMSSTHVAKNPIYYVFSDKIY